MRPGAAADDAWIMVEDEFLSTAQIFTRHIHEAEYARLKKLVRERGKGTLAAIVRPTDGWTTQNTGSRSQSELREMEKGMRESIVGVVEAETDGQNDDEDEYLHDPQLAGLMASQAVGLDLTGFGKAKANTRAAAGFAKSPLKMKWRVLQAERNSGLSKSCEREEQSEEEAAAEEEEGIETDDGDLNAMPCRKDELKRVRPSPSNTRLAGGERKSESNVSTHIFKPFAKSTVTLDPAKEKRWNPSMESPSPQVKCPTFSPKVWETGMSDQLFKRRTTRDTKGRNEETKQKALPTIDVPTFII